MPTNNTILKALKIQELVCKHYEAGRQDRCKLWVFRNIVVKIYPMTERTFYRYMAIDTESKEEIKKDCRQLKLFN
jgi:heat shock protein HspQ